MTKRLRWAPLLWVAAGVLGAQTVRSTVTAGERGPPAAGAIVLLMDSAGRELARALTDGRGAFTVAAPGAGAYRLRVLRIGFKRWDSPALTLAPGETYTAPVVVPDAPVLLAAITVEADAKCRVYPEEGSAAATLWEEAHKALEATELAMQARAYRFHTSSYVRTLGADLTIVLDEQRSEGVGFSDWPSASIPAESLALHGYVQPGEGGPTYYGPDVSVFFSDAFLRQHCFRVAPPSLSRPADSALVGLAFEPVTDRRLPDVTGVLWLDRANARLRFLEYRYTDLERWVPAANVGGRLDFERLPSGAWMIRRWWIRAPIPEIREIGGRRSSRLYGYRERGAEVTGAFTAAGAPVPLEPPPERP